MTDDPHDRDDDPDTDGDVDGDGDGSADGGDADDASGGHVPTGPYGGDSDDLASAETDRERALAELREVREHARYKVFGKGRIRSESKEKVRIKWARLIVQSANAERRILNDRELEELAAELDAIRDRIDGPTDGGDTDGTADVLADGRGPRPVESVRRGEPSDDDGGAGPSGSAPASR